MTTEPSALSRWCRTAVLLIGLLFVFAAAGCGLIADEIMWLDRVPTPAPDAVDALTTP